VLCRRKVEEKPLQRKQGPTTDKQKLPGGKATKREQKNKVKELSSMVAIQSTCECSTQTRPKRGEVLCSKNSCLFFSLSPVSLLLYYQTLIMTLILTNIRTILTMFSPTVKKPKLHQHSQNTCNTTVSFYSASTA
jgi:hypothetical protein